MQKLWSMMQQSLHFVCSSGTAILTSPDLYIFNTREGLARETSYISQPLIVL